MRENPLRESGSVPRGVRNKLLPAPLLAASQARIYVRGGVTRVEVILIPPFEKCGVCPRISSRRVRFRQVRALLPHSQVRTGGRHFIHMQQIDYWLQFPS